MPNLHQIMRDIPSKFIFDKLNIEFHWAPFIFIFKNYKQISLILHDTIKQDFPSGFETVV